MKARFKRLYIHNIHIQTGVQFWKQNIFMAVAFRGQSPLLERDGPSHKELHFCPYNTAPEISATRSPTRRQSTAQICGEAAVRSLTRCLGDSAGAGSR